MRLQRLRRHHTHQPISTQPQDESLRLRLSYGYRI
jgi:hypothetical protein